MDPQEHMCMWKQREGRLLVVSRDVDLVQVPAADPMTANYIMISLQVPRKASSSVILKPQQLLKTPVDSWYPSVSALYPHPSHLPELLCAFHPNTSIQHLYTAQPPQKITAALPQNRFIKRPHRLTKTTL